MNKPVYINSIGSVSVQKTFDNAEFLNEIMTYNDTVASVINPDYKAYIPPAQARRMAKAIKMSTVSSKTALQEAGLANVDAIIVGTGLGCLTESEKFVGDIITNTEQYLTPTRFIQSSHNTVAGQIALGIGCKGYNFTYVHGAVSFESALIDAKMQLELDEAQNILVGGVDEIAKYHVDSHRLIGHTKAEPIESTKLLESNTKGAVLAEGSHFFVLSNQKQESTYAELLAVESYNIIAKEHVSEKIESFLKEQNTAIEDIDLVILGNNGDIEYDHYYNDLSDDIFKNTPQSYFKHLSGEFYTATAFAFWLASKIIKSQTIPSAVKLNALNMQNPKTILIYNQYRGENHSLVLLRKC
jgi:3-oxoacyl-(acyl-carrier-protein) synthase